MNMNGGISLDNTDVLSRHSHIYGGVHRHKRGNIAYGIQNLSTGLHGNAQPLTTCNLRYPTMLIINLHDPKTGGGFLPECDLTFSNVLGKMDKKKTILFFDQQFRFSGDNLHWYMIGLFEKDQWMSNQSRQRFIHIKLTTAIPGTGIANLTQSSANPFIPGRQKIKILAMYHQPVQGNSPPFAPLMRCRPFLLFRQQIHGVIDKINHPGQTGCPLRCPHPAGHGDQFLQTAFPGIFKRNNMNNSPAMEFFS